MEIYMYYPASWNWVFTCILLYSYWHIQLLLPSFTNRLDGHINHLSFTQSSCISSPVFNLILCKRNWFTYFSLSNNFLALFKHTLRFQPDSSGGHKCPKPEVVAKSRLGPKRWNRMFRNLRLHSKCKWDAVFVSLVTPHLKVDYFTKRPKYSWIVFFLKLDVVFYCSQYGGPCFPPTIF